jgi:hypothetical protein
MLSIFGKKAGKYPTESKWAILQGRENGRPMLFRRNVSAKTLSSDKQYGHRVGIAIPLLEPNEMGFPSKVEMDILSQVEDELCEKLEKDQMSIMVLVITTGGMREFVFYTRSPEMISPILEDIRKKYSTYEIQSYIKEDKTWLVYRKIR